MSSDEYCVFSLVIQLADFRTGVWTGSGVAVSDYLKWCSRKSQLILRSLERKGYLDLNIVKGRKGNYAIKVRNYHGSPNGDSVKAKISEPRFADGYGSPNGDATLKEVIQEKSKEQTRAEPRRADRPSPEQVRKVEAKQKRLSKEEAGWREGQLMEIVTQGLPRKDYLEFLDLRDAGKLPKGTTWDKWRDLTPQQKQRVLKAA